MVRDVDEKICELEENSHKKLDEVEDKLDIQTYPFKTDKDLKKEDTRTNFKRIPSEVAEVKKETLYQTAASGAVELETTSRMKPPLFNVSCCWTV